MSYDEFYFEQNQKVVHITTVHPVFDTRIFHKEAKTLAQAGYDTTLIAQHNQNETINKINILALPKPRNRFARIFILSWQAFKLAMQKKAHIYHFHDPELLPIGVLLKLFTQAKVIYDVHEDVPQQILTKHWIPVYLRKPISTLFNIIEKLLTKFIDAVVVATEGIAEKFAKFNPVVVHNYPDLEMLPNLSKVHKKDSKVLVYVGGISRIRGILEIIRALEYLDHINDLRLDLIGKFEPPELENELQKLPGYKRVRYLGWLQPTEIYNHIKETNAGLVCLHPEPRFIKALPVKLFEYMAAGLPVISSNFPLWKEIVEGNKCGICVDPLNPKDIAQAIEYLLTHPEEAQKMGQNGRLAIEQKYNWKIESQNLLKLYQNLLNKGNE
ncbi:MAG: glycosyltransferase family 4 protein [bacterium]